MLLNSVFLILFQAVDVSESYHQQINFTGRRPRIGCPEISYSAVFVAFVLCPSNLHSCFVVINITFPPGKGIIINIRIKQYDFFLAKQTTIHFLMIIVNLRIKISGVSAYYSLKTRQRKKKQTTCVVLCFT